jgi:lipoate-protein ligase B
MSRSAWLLDLNDGLTPYADAWALQSTLVAARQRGEIGDGLVLLEHEPVFTMGRSTLGDHLPFPREYLTRLGFGIYDVERGGSITYHGPGQLVGYPIVDLRAYDEDIVKYMRTLEGVMIRTLADFGISAERLRGYPGVWVRGEKIAAVGVAVKRKVTMHGFALNVNPTLEHFSYIDPCGLGRPVTSMSRVLGRVVKLAPVRNVYAQRFAEIFGVTFIPQSREALLGTVASV